MPPVYRTSKFTELFDGPEMPDHGPHGRFTETFDVDFPFMNNNPGPATEVARADLQMANPNPPAEPDATSVAPADIPTSAPNPPPEPNKPEHQHYLPIMKDLSSRPPTPVTPSPGSHSASGVSPSSVYSRATSASKPFSPLDSPELRTTGDFFVWNSVRGPCDTRHLFEGNAVPVKVLVAAVEVLAEQGDAGDVNVVREFRVRLPRYGAWVKERTQGGNCEEEVAWLRSQRVYAGHERAVLAKAGVNSVGKGGEAKGVGRSEDGVEVLEAGDGNGEGSFRRCSDDGVELPESVSEARGRDRTPRRATSAKRIFRGLESW